MESKLKELNDEVKFRETQFRLLFDLLVGSDCVLHPTIHAFGLSGTGKTYAIRKFMHKFCDNESKSQFDSNSNSKSSHALDARIVNKYYVYLNCHELCYGSMSLLFNAIIDQLRAILVGQDRELGLNRMQYDDELNNDADCSALQFGHFANDDDPTPSATTTTTASASAATSARMLDCSIFVRVLRKHLSRLMHHTCLYFVFDNAESLRAFGDIGNLLLTLSKLNEYVGAGGGEAGAACDDLDRISMCSLFVSEVDWHSLLSDFDAMSKTDAPRPFIIHFNDYSKDQMHVILSKTARHLVTRQDMSGGKSGEDAQADGSGGSKHNVEFYARVILDVFFSICKDLNEIQYLIQIYYDLLLTNAATPQGQGTNEMGEDTNKRMVAMYSKIKPFLKQALTQIYLRQSGVNMGPAPANGGAGGDELTRDFASMNLLSESSSSSSRINSNNNTSAPHSASSFVSHLPKLMKFLLISAYIATHNPVKYDKKLFDYNSVVKNARKSRFTAQKMQQNEENQRAAALKTQAADLNRLMAIFFAICAENASSGSAGCMGAISLNLVQNDLKTLKNLNYLQQTNSSYSSLDEPKFKCLLDFESIHAISASVNFNIKQYLAEYINI